MKRILPLFLILCCCASVQQQGIYGKVFWLEGNLMPGPDKPTTAQQGTKRIIEIYPALYQHDAQVSDGYFYTITEKPLHTTESDRHGNFKINLPPGVYSVFTRESKGLFANQFDGAGCINCVAVKPNHFTWHTLSIDYEASY
jgi:hypothetical protein